MELFLSTHLVFELGLLVGLLTSMGFASRLRKRRDLAPRWAFYLNLSGVGFYILVIVVINGVTLFR